MTPNAWDGEQVLLVKVKLDGKMYSEKLHLKHDRKSTDGSKVARKMKDIVNFLEQYKTAKVLVILNTHALRESGYLVWKGSSKAHNLHSCHLGEVAIVW